MGAPVEMFNEKVVTVRSGPMVFVELKSYLSQIQSKAKFIIAELGKPDCFSECYICLALTVFSYTGSQLVFIEATKARWHYSQNHEFWFLFL